jgi:glycosyltransferase involved in cell wall biosynthesis
MAVYSHPEHLPPTLNAIEVLSGKYDHIYVVHRSVTGFDWVYPSNVTLLSADTAIPVREAERRSVWKKITEFLRYSFLLAKTIRRHKSRDLLFYDFMPLLSFRLIKWSIPRQQLLWYHNHDVAEKNYIRKYSLAWCAWKTEKWIFPKLSLFTLPAVERKECFPMEKLKGSFFLIPNFPSIKAYGAYRSPKINNAVVRILYQGGVSPGHGLEEIIALLDKKIQGRELNLVLKGYIAPEYLAQLNALAEKHNVKDKLSYKGYVSYREIINNTSNCHIGIAIYRKQDIANTTAGTASNKIYEYAALGMPTLLYDIAHYRQYLDALAWTFFTDCSAASLTDCFEKIIAGYDSYSNQARKDFTERLNFEHFFLPVLDQLDHLSVKEYPKKSI